MANLNGSTLWFTGLPCSGKSTLTELVAQQLRERGHEVEVFDGDQVRKYLSPDLGFSKADRDENVRRVGYVCHLLAKHGTIAIVALVSPYRAARDDVRTQGGRFVEVYVKASVETCRKRDVKGMYARALQGQISNFTGVNDPYEAPIHPEIEVDTDENDPAASAGHVIARLEELGVIKRVSDVAAGKPA